MLQPRHTGTIFRLWAVIAVGIAVQCPALAQGSPDKNGKVIEFDPPLVTTEVSAACGSGCGTQALANNDFGVVVGYYTDAKVVEHGFFRTPFGQIVSFDAPQAGLGKNDDDGTVAYSINDFGVIVGAVQDSSNVQHGFIRYVDGSFRNFDVKDAGTAMDPECAPSCGTYAFSVNLQGGIAGIYVDANNEYHGFVRRPDGEIQTFDPSGSVFTYVCEETCLNAAGVSTGFWEDANGNYHGFIREPDGAITVVDVPGANGFSGCASINWEGATTGYFLGSDGVYHGYVRSPEGTFTTFDAPGAAGLGTAVFSINAVGTVTGEYFDAGNALHGYSRTADGVFSTFDAPNGGTTAFQGTRPSTNNLLGSVAGWYVDENGLNHGFVWVP